MNAVGRVENGEAVLYGNTGKGSGGASASEIERLELLIEENRALAEENMELINELKNQKSSAEEYGLSKTCPVDVVDVTEDNGQVLAAFEKNASIEGTLANEIKALEDELSAKRPEFYATFGRGSCSLSLGIASAYLVTARAFRVTNANQRTIKFAFVEAWSTTTNIIDIGSANGSSAYTCDLSAQVSGNKLVVTLTGDDNAAYVTLSAIKLVGQES